MGPDLVSQASGPASYVIGSLCAVSLGARAIPGRRALVDSRAGEYDSNGGEKWEATPASDRVRLRGIARMHWNSVGMRGAAASGVSVYVPPRRVFDSAADPERMLAHSIRHCSRPWECTGLGCRVPGCVGPVRCAVRRNADQQISVTQRATPADVCSQNRSSLWRDASDGLTEFVPRSRSDASRSPPDSGLRRSRKLALQARHCGAVSMRMDFGAPYEDVIGYRWNSLPGLEAREPESMSTLRSLGDPMPFAMPQEQLWLRR